MTTAVAKRDAIQEVAHTIDRPEFQQQLAEALAGANVTVEKFIRTTKLAIQLNPEILDGTDRRSLFVAMVRCAADGLLPDGRQAALVKVRVKGKDTVAYWPMVGGLRYTAAKHGFALEAHAVYSLDQFDWQLGFDPRVDHHPPPLDRERGDLIGAYAVATRLEDGRKFIEVMGRGEIEQIRAKAPSAKSEWSPWNTATSEMYRKTAARRLFKQLPLGDLEEREARLIASDGQVDEATSEVPAVANLPIVDPSDDDVEVVEADEIVEPDAA